MEEMSQTVQNANTHILWCQNHEHAHSSRSVQGGDGGHVTSTRTAVGQFKGQFNGRWRKHLGKGRRRAHKTRFVRIHVGVGQRCRALDVESSGLQGATAKCATFQRGNGTLHMGSIRGKAHPLPNRHMATVSTPVGRWMKCHRRFKMQTLTYCDAKITSTRTAVGQFKGQFNGAMEETSRQGQKASTQKSLR